VLDCCESGNESSGSIEGITFFEQRIYKQLNGVNYFGTMATNRLKIGMEPTPNRHVYYNSDNGAMLNIILAYQHDSL
jgi:hypothetical protein